MSFVYRTIYIQNLSNIVIFIFLISLIWTMAAWICGRGGKAHRIWRCLNALAFGVGVAGVIGVTVVFREPGELEVCLIPFYSFVEAKIQPEMYRSMLMNVLLFVPPGLSLPYLLPEKWSVKRKIWGTILCGAVLSGLMEGLQLVFRLGRVETDDVLCNAFGCVIGAAAFALGRQKEAEI